MLEFHNAQERDLHDWKELFARADPRLQVREVQKPKGSRLSIIEVGLDDNHVHYTK